MLEEARMTATEVMCGLVKNMKVVMEGAHRLASLLKFRLTSALSSRRKAVDGWRPPRSRRALGMFFSHSRSELAATLK